MHPMPVLAYVLTLVTENDGIVATRWRPELSQRAPLGKCAVAFRLWMARQCLGLDLDPLSHLKTGRA